MTDGEVFDHPVMHGVPWCMDRYDRLVGFKCPTCQRVFEAGEPVVRVLVAESPQLCAEWRRQCWMDATAIVHTRCGHDHWPWRMR